MRARRRRRPSARRLGVDVVAPGDARDAVAGEEDEVEQRRGEPDHGLDAAAARELGGSAVRHSARL